MDGVTNLDEYPLQKIPIPSILLVKILNISKLELNLHRTLEQLDLTWGGL